MEVARLMKLNRFRPKRTVVFALWAAEEEGLLGSKYYTENPLYPLDKTVAYINLDMEGHGTGRVNFRAPTTGPRSGRSSRPAFPRRFWITSTPAAAVPAGPTTLISCPAASRRFSQRPTAPTSGPTVSATSST